MPTGRFLTFEGIDGAGKSTHLDQAVAWLRQRGHDVVVTREPGGTELAETLRELVLHASMDVLTEVLLVFAARRDHLTRVIAPALAAGRHVVCDRFTDASFAYQGGGRGVDVGVLAQLESWVQQGLGPDLTLWFDLPPSTAAARRAQARLPDRFERQDEAFFERVRQGYEQRRRQSPQRIRRIDAVGTEPEVWSRVLAQLQETGWW